MERLRPGSGHPTAVELRLPREVHTGGYIWLGDAQTLFLSSVRYSLNPSLIVLSLSLSLLLYII